MKKFIQASVCVLMAQLVSGCADKCKIDPPASVVGTDKEASAKVAANTLSTAISGGEVSGSYKNAVNNTYQAVGQDDIAFYLLMQAYNCESKRGHATGLRKFWRWRGRNSLAVTRQRPIQPRWP